MFDFTVSMGCVATADKPPEMAPSSMDSAAFRGAKVSARRLVLVVLVVLVVRVVLAELMELKVLNLLLLVLRVFLVVILVVWLALV